MKISYNWLKSYLPVELPAKEVASLLTFAGLEVEGIETYQTIKGGLSGLVIGEVITCDRHPNADKLSLTTVNIGTEQLLQIVCGAPNVAAGQKVIVAPVGTTVHPLTGDSFEIKKSKIRGETSEGMICAEDEIGLGGSHAGIMVLPSDATVGLPVKDYFSVEDDYVFEIGLTPNRVDAASHIGVARDLAALLNLSAGDAVAYVPVLPDVSSCSQDVDGTAIQVEVQDAEGCPRYSGVTIENVQVKDSPEWLQHRLRSIGINPINNIVDVTNFVLHECGQPLHAFDASKIKGGKVVVRRADEGASFTTLDKVERKLSGNDLMICHTSGPMCIAGVFGGLESGITPDTTSVFLESAYFDPSSIRKTGKFHALKTDASFRYERGADPEITVYALKRAAALICELAGGRISSPVIDLYPQPKQNAIIDFDYSYLDRFAGVSIDRSKVRIILHALGMEFIKEDAQSCSVKVPSGKVDVTRPVDLVEEVLRIYGYDNIPVPDKLNASLPAVTGFNEDAYQEKVAAQLAAAGFNEIFTNSLTKTAYADDSDRKVELLNPLSQELGMLRMDLLNTGLEAVQYNRNRKQPNSMFFEFGKVYGKSDKGYTEEKRLLLLISGSSSEESWNTVPAPVDFFFLKGHVNRILHLAGIDSRKVNTEPSVHPSHATGLTYRLGEKTLVSFGMVKKSVLRKFDITSETGHAEFHWDVVMKVVKKKPVQYTELSKFPQVRRDLSMLIGKEVEFSRIEHIALRTEKKLLRSVQLFDVYEGEKLEAGKKSYAVAFMLQDDQQTLTDQQIDKTMDRLMAALEKEAGAVIRKS